MIRSYDLLFYAVFLGQICLISLYLPKKILARMRSVLETYPPADYPKLYPKKIEDYLVGHKLYELLNRGIFALGFVILLPWSPSSITPPLRTTVTSRRPFLQPTAFSSSFPC